MAVTIATIAAMKERGERFTMLTAYDYSMARLVAEAEIPVILIGDSLGMTMLGYTSTVPVTMDDMLHHTRAVVRGAPESLLVGDMPFNSYHASDEEAIRNAAAFLQAGAHTVKMEGGGRITDLVAKLTERGIPVMAHLGLTPQFVNLMGGYKVQGREADAAARIRTDAVALQDAGAYAVVLEGVPRSVGADVTAALRIPTIGIGAGPDCDGQVLVIHDLLGLNRGHQAKFVKRNAELGDATVAAAKAFAADVSSGTFPDDEHSYS